MQIVHSTHVFSISKINGIIVPIGPSALELSLVGNFYTLLVYRYECYLYHVCMWPVSLERYEIIPRPFSNLTTKIKH